MTDDLHALAGAYATDALDDDERSRFEAHLADCPACTDEVAGFREALAALAASHAVLPPAGLEDRVVGAAMAAPVEPSPGAPPGGPAPDDAPSGSESPGAPRPQLADLVAPAPAPARRRPMRTTLSLAAAAAALFAGGALLGRTTAPEAQVAQSGQDPMGSILAVAAAPDATFLPLDVMGTQSRVVVSREMGKVAFLADDLPRPAKGLCYQVWRVAPDGTKTSVGVFTPDPQGHVAVVLEGGGRGDSFVITTEPPGGSAKPTGQMVGQLDA